VRRRVFQVRIPDPRPALISGIWTLTFGLYSVIFSFVKKTAILFLLTAALFCGRGTSVKTDTRVVARVNSDVIVASDLTGIMPSPTSDTQAWQQSKRRLLDQMIDQKLIVQLGRELGYLDSISAPLEKHKADLVRTELQQYARGLPVSGPDVARESLLLYTSVHLKLMELPTYDTAQTVQMLLKNGVPFESLVVRYSRSKLGGPGGEMGYVPLGRVPPEIASALANLKPGGATDLIFRGIYYDFVKLEDRHLAPAESMTIKHDQLVLSARARKAAEFVQEIRNRVQYDERALDFLTTNPDSVKSSDSAMVVARLPDGYKTRVGSLLPTVKSYGDVFPSVRRRALKEDIENDILEREALRLKLDKTPDYQAQLKRLTDRVLYEFCFDRQVNARSRPGDSEVTAYFHEHPETYPASELTPELAADIRARLMRPRQQENVAKLASELRAKARISVDDKLLAALKPEKAAK